MHVQYFMVEPMCYQHIPLKSLWAGESESSDYELSVTSADVGNNAPEPEDPHFG